MRKILYYAEAWGLGGIESFIMNAIRGFDQREFTVSIFSVHDWSDAYDEELEALGVSRFCLYKGYKPSLLKRYVTGVTAWRKIIKQQKPDIVHVNVMNGLGLIYAAVAKGMGVRLCVAHSHNTSFGSGSRTIKTCAHFIGKMLFTRQVDKRIACSSEAGHYIFDDKTFEVICNGIDVQRFRFDADARHRVRESLGIGNEVFVFGSVGRISEQKNPVFQLNLLEDLLKAGINARLLLVGTGAMFGEVKKEAARRSVASYVSMPGATSVPEDFLCALDAMTMPSLFEGAPFALVEALCNGLPCIVSESVPQPVSVDAQVTKLSLDRIDVWEDELSSRALSGATDRMQGLNAVAGTSYDSECMRTRLQSIYEMQ
jgi:glycosyltransferase involved in cell wall biosynthesis